MAATYAKYLKLGELLSLQNPVSEGPEHDETLFIIIHQVYELWFKEMLHEIDYLVTLLDRGEVARFEPKGGQTFPIDIEAEPSGVERLLILTARVLPQSPIVSFAGLTQQPLPMFARATGNPLDLWEGAAFGTNPLDAALNATRGGRAPAGASIGVTTYTWTVVPRDSPTAACTTE